MLRSMYSGVSGLRGHQTMMDVVGNNIANVNTTGFKASQTIFQDLLSQVLQGAGMPMTATAGTNPAQVGLGMRLGATMTSFSQGGLQYTGRSTDLSIQGDGFFTVRNGGETLYTRAGAFSFDANGRLTTPSGAIVQGWTADANGGVNTNASVGDIVLPIGQLNSPSATRLAELGGNLPADAAEGAEIRAAITFYDDQGGPVNVNFVFTKQAGNEWSMQAQSDTDGDGTLDDVGAAQTVAFDGSGVLSSATEYTLAGLPGSWGTDPTISFGAQGQPLTGFAGVNTAAALTQNGAPAGSLQGFTISPDGVISGVFSNGRNQPLGQVALTSFNNPSGLEKTGNSMYRTTVNSGQAQVGIAGAGGRGVLAGGTLEMSNVDIAQEFTNLIVAQRGFQANSRVVTTSDELLQELVNMKR